MRLTILHESTAVATELPYVDPDVIWVYYRENNQYGLVSPKSWTFIYGFNKRSPLTGGLIWDISPDVTHSPLEAQNRVWFRENDYDSQIRGRTGQLGENEQWRNRAGFPSQTR